MIQQWINETNNKVLIAEGNTRLVYYFTSEYIIKKDVSNEKLKYQSNNVEYKIYKESTPKERAILCPVIGIYEGGEYIVCSKCIPLDCVLLDQYHIEIDELESSFQDVRDFIKTYPEYELDLILVSDFCKRFKLHGDELMSIYNWGLLKNKLVCLDFELLIE